MDQEKKDCSSPISPHTSANDARKKEKDGSSKEEREDRKVVTDSSLVNSLYSLKLIKNLNFTVDCNVFNDLVKALYCHICNAYQNYSESVTMGMFNYYCGMELWYRLATIGYVRYENNSWEYLTMKSSFGNNLILPEAFCRFLDMIGDFIEPQDNVYWKLHVTLPNENGHFGKMSATTFLDYVAYPAPAVLSAALKRELDLIIGDTVVDFSALTTLAEVHYNNRPEEVKFNENLCGNFIFPPTSVYKKNYSAEFGESVRGLLTTTEHHGEYFPYSSDLMNHITECNKTLCNNYPMEKYCNESELGSAMQMGFVWCENDGGVTLIQGFSPFMLPYELSKLIPVFRLRIQRDNSEEVNYDYPYTFSDAANIPAGWYAHLNGSFHFGEAALRLNLCVFSTGKVDPSIGIGEYVKSFQVKLNEDFTA